MRHAQLFYYSTVSWHRCQIECHGVLL